MFLIARFAAIGAALAQPRAQQLPAQFERLAPVCARDLLGAIGIARFERLQQVAMLFERFDRPALDAMLKGIERAAAEPDKNSKKTGGAS